MNKITINFIVVFLLFAVSSGVHAQTKISGSSTSRPPKAGNVTGNISAGQGAKETSSPSKAAAVASPVKSVPLAGVPASPAPSTPDLNANKLSGRSGKAPGTPQQEMMIEIAGARIVRVDNSNSYTHRWEVDVRNRTYTAIAEQIGAEAHQYAGTQSVALAGGSSIMGIGPNEVKTIAGGFKVADGVDNIKVAVRFFNLLVGERTLIMPIAMGKVVMPMKSVAERSNIAAAQANPAIQGSNAVMVDGIVPAQFNVTSLEAFQMAGDTFLWQAKVRNIKSQAISNVKILSSVMVNGSWVPAGNEINVADFGAGMEKSYNSTFQGPGATKIKLDILINHDGAYQLNASKTIDFIPAQASNMAQNFTIDSFTAVPAENGHWRMEARVTNNNPVAFNQKLGVQGKIYSDNQWRDCGGSSYNSVAAGETKTTGINFFRNVSATQVKVAISVLDTGDLVKESTPVMITPITINVAVNNPTITRSGTIANWSASILSSSSDALYDIKIKTYHRQNDGAWAQASNAQSLASLVPGNAVNVNGVFTPGSSNQFKIEVEYHHSDSGGIQGAIHSVAKTWEGGF